MQKFTRLAVSIAVQFGRQIAKRCSVPFCAVDIFRFFYFVAIFYTSARLYVRINCSIKSWQAGGRILLDICKINFVHDLKRRMTIKMQGNDD